jgi:radical SAM protein with 4Fe4S-binding SPASM domain
MCKLLQQLYLLLLRPGYSLRRIYLYLEKHYFRHSQVLCGPVRVKINTGYRCNLRCPLCPSGLKVPGNSKDLTINDVQFLFGRLGRFYYVSLFGWSESFLVKDIFKSISYLKKMGKIVDIDSNLNIQKEEIVRQIEESELDILSVSLDGVDQKSYSTYRYGGSFDLVIRNIRRLRAAQKGPKKIEWQYLVSKKNIQYVEKAKVMAEELGIPICFYNIGMYLDMFYENTSQLEQQWRTDDQIERMGNFCKPGEVCTYMYNDPFIDPDGRVYPCCNAARAPEALLEKDYKNVFGNLHDDNLFEIWNNEYYRMMRCLFAGRQYEGKKIKPICLMCKVYLDSCGVACEERPIFSP